FPRSGRAPGRTHRPGAAPRLRARGGAGPDTDRVPAARVPAAPAGPGVQPATSARYRYWWRLGRAGADDRRAYQDAAQKARLGRPDRDGPRPGLPLSGKPGLMPANWSNRRRDRRARVEFGQHGLAGSFVAHEPVIVGVLLPPPGGWLLDDA